MKVIDITGHGGTDVLHLGQRPVPVPGAGELLIRVAASGVNRPDVLQRLGNYPVPPGASDILGLEVAGVIEQGDPAELAAAGFKLGDRICALVAGGGYAEYCVAPIAQTLPVPEGLTDVEAASLPETFFTVWSNMMQRARLQPGESVLIQGGSSGIGVTAIQLAKYIGAKVFVTAGSDEKCAACLELGADFAINYKALDFQEELMRLTDGQGVDVILDMVAGSYVAKEVQCLKEDGRLVIISILGGSRSEFNAGLVLRKRLTITGSTLRPRSVAFKAAIAQACLENIWPALTAKRIKPVIFRTFAAEQVAQAHALMESSQHVGKIVLTWS
ncbi:NAD(P)H-quinone oxidoreductase [Rhodoferax antarcticus]|uniref:NAD(P)H quinone oxidoreductase, PIG3 family protein n=1 Tax=Rhodoferax antarcticus ANT.BR TaxID=1111071 RepID=A0A1Q8YE39_9BURK|nr:NAD(P)H-quinone oxidoreductase [Rhodoferax antarcticus]APW45980.1 NAD(P)H-quinone oxidoreductase [Rhodoferax antarcticus]MCW2310470.1 NADPH2:quinone reductase [Rhodoferax antarcticus]OLP06110.1 NAD(P)H quinone oxidoreductase, PIG3 family protein [Rhodoferax antarcticus ANT.BR]